MLHNFAKRHILYYRYVTISKILFFKGGLMIMRTMGLDERLGITANSGRFGRTFAVWKGQIERLEKKGITVLPLKELKKAYYLCYISWLSPKPGTFSEELHKIALENCIPVHCSDYTSVRSYLQQVSSMTALSAVVSVDDKSITEELEKEGFAFTVLNEVPLTLYIDWYQAPDNTIASTYAASAIKLWMSEAHFTK